MSLLTALPELTEMEQHMFPGKYQFVEGSSTDNYIFSSNRPIATVPAQVYTGQRGREIWPEFGNAEGFVALRNAAPSMLAVLSKFEKNDSERLEYAVWYLESTNCPTQCIDAVKRAQEAARMMEE
jgi:hypothetical protein